MQKISLNLGRGDLAAIDQIAARFVMARRHAVARAALRAGLDQMARDHEFAREHLMREAGIVESQAQ
jgi:hypothetical protein